MCLIRLRTTHFINNDVVYLITTRKKHVDYNKLGKQRIFRLFEIAFFIFFLKIRCLYEYVCSHVTISTLLLYILILLLLMELPTSTLHVSGIVYIILYTH